MGQQHAYPGSIMRFSVTALMLTAVDALHMPMTSSRQFTNPRRMMTRPQATIESTGSIVLDQSEPVASDGMAEPERWSKSTKQLATLGPASSTFEMLEALFLAGADVFRLNFSHGKHDEKAALVEKIRAVEAKHGRPIAVLADLQGPKLRVGTFVNDEKQYLERGQRFRFDLDVDTPGDKTRVALPHPEILQTLSVGDTLLVDDGKVRLIVTGTGVDFAETIVEVAGSISNRKGVNTPSVVLPISPLTPKDRQDLQFALTLDIDWVALSFVQRPEDIEELKTFIEKSIEDPGQLAIRAPRIMAKLEKPAAVQDPGTLKRIVELCDGIMVARGDLGVETRPEDVPVIQKQIITECRRQGTPVVVATQMLESMIDAPTPTRAECSDIATALYDGADAVMLSAESAAGSYPIEAVSMQRRVISRVESDPLYRLQQTTDISKTKPQTTATDAVTLAARQIVDTVKAKCLCIFTERGTTVLRAAKGRPSSPILALAPTPQTARALQMVWGVHSIVMELPSDEEGRAVLNDAVLQSVTDAAKSRGYLEEPTDLAVITAGLPLGTPGAANVIRVVPAVGPTEWPDALCFPDTEECFEP